MLTEDRTASLVAIKKSRIDAGVIIHPLVSVVSQPTGMGCVLLAHHPLLFVSNSLGN